MIKLTIWYWLVVGPPLWKIRKSIGMIRNPIYGKIKNGNQTTNQWYLDVSENGDTPANSQLMGKMMIHICGSNVVFALVFPTFSDERPDAVLEALIPSTLAVPLGGKEIIGVVLTAPIVCGWSLITTSYQSLESHTEKKQSNELTWRFPKSWGYPQIIYLSGIAH